METAQNENGSKKLMMGIIVALLLVTGVSLYFVFSGHQENDDLSAQKTTLDSTFKSLSDTMDVRNGELEQITDKNTRLDSLVSINETTIANEKKQIAGLLAKTKMTKSELAEANAMIVQYQASISDLQKAVVELSAQNQQLTTDNQKLSTDLTTEKKTTSDLSTQNQGLAKTVEVGSLLQLNNVEASGIKIRQNGKEVVVRRAKATESLRVSFETGLNKILPVGTVSLYVRIINPKGETISMVDQGSGSMQLANSGPQMLYTKRADFAWNQTNKKVLVYWKQDNAAEGVYKVEIYQAGYLVGNGQVKLD
jgi:myosin heavy subunit